MCADPRRRSRAGAAGVNAIGNHVGHEGVEEGEQVAGGGQRTERADRDRGAERRTFLRRLRRLGEGFGRERKKDDEQDDGNGLVESGHAGNHFQ